MSNTALRLPDGSCDCHFHIYGPFERFPAGSEGRFTPARAFTIEDAFALWDRIGVMRGVIVHAVGSGADNAVTFEALRRFPDRLRATAILQPDVTDRRLDELTDAGFKAVRVTMIRQDGKPVSTLGTSFDDLVELAPRLAERGWHAQIWIESSDLAAAAESLERLPLTYVVDHMCRTMADKGHRHPDYVAFTERLKTGRYWVKISGADRNTRAGRPTGIPRPSCARSSRRRRTRSCGAATGRMSGTRTRPGPTSRTCCSSCGIASPTRRCAAES